MHTQTSLFVVLVVLCALSVCMVHADSPWPFYKHDTKMSGRTEAARFEVPVLLWKASFRGEGTAPPVIDWAGKVVVGFPMYLFSMEPELGEISWSHLTLGMMETSPCVDPIGNIYFADSSGDIVALELSLIHI